MEAAHQTLIETLDHKKAREAEGTESGAWTVIIAGFPTFVKATKADPHNIQTARKFLNLWAN